jgi:hypothetical protein
VLLFIAAKVTKWHKQEGDIIRYEDEICDIELKVSGDLVENFRQRRYRPRIVLFTGFYFIQTHTQTHTLTLGLHLYVDC